jgi:hypothetical protein
MSLPTGSWGGIWSWPGREALFSIWVRRLAEGDAREVDSSQFRASLDEVRAELTGLTDGGKRPALLIAPFYQEEVGGVARFEVGLRRSWDRSPWRSNAQASAGDLVRPLNRLDHDLRAIGRYVGDLPVMLISGSVQRGRRLLPELTAWNLTAPGSVVSLALSPIMQPEGDADTMIAFEDALGELFATVAGGLADWFHLMNNQRAPLHMPIVLAQKGVREMIALNGVVAFDEAVDRGLLPVETALVNQARMLGAGELVADARAAADAGLVAIAAAELPTDALVDLTRSLAETAESIGDADLGARARALLDELYRRGLGEMLGGGA